MAWQSSSLAGTKDVVVLGATVAGLTTAIEVARAGASVTVLDPSHSTRFGLGLITVGQGSTLREIELHRGAAAGRRLAAADVAEPRRHDHRPRRVRAVRRRSSRVPPRPGEATPPPRG